MITGPTTGLLRTKVKGLRVEDEEVESIERRGVHFSMPIPEKVRRSDKLYIVEQA